MLILTYIALVLISVYVMIYLYKRFFSEKKLYNELKENWGIPKNGRYFDFDLIENYFLNTIGESAEKLQLISDKIANDLYLDDVFKIIDRTVSRIGQQFLYARLRTFEKDTAKLMDLEALAEEMMNNEPLRFKTQLILQKLEKNDSYYFQDLIYSRHIVRPAFMPFVYLHTAAGIFCLLAAFSHPGFLLVFMGIFIINLILHYKNKQIVDLHTSTLKEFLKVYETAGKLNKSQPLKEYFPETISLIKELKPLKKKMLLIKLDVMAEGDMAMIGYVIFELIKIAFNVEIIVFYAVIDALSKKKRELKDLFNYIGKIDTAISIASFRDSLAYYCKPEFSTKNQIELSGIVHPLVDKCIPNDLSLMNKNLLLTGSNMSGKTTFIRSVGINIILAQTINTCTARKFNAPYSKIFSSITISDSLLEDKSYYFEEMTIIKNFIKESAAAEPCFFIMDEIFKGTNTIERVSAGKAILSYLAKSNNFIFVSTHDTELNELLKQQYELYHFSETVEEEALIFDHMIKKGPLKTRNAIRILEINGYPAEIVTDANATVDLISKI